MPRSTTRKRNVLVSSAAGMVLVSVLAWQNPAHAFLANLTVDKCLASKVKTEAKGAAAYVGCYGKDAATPDAAKLTDCLTKASAKISGAFAKLDTKYPTCTGGTGNGSTRDTDTASYAQSVSTDVGSAVGKCDAEKDKCVGKYVAAIGGCYAKAATKTGVVDNAPAGCTAKAVAKLADGAKGCLDKAAAVGDCTNGGSQATLLRAAADAYIDEQACALDPTNSGCATPTPTPTSTPTATSTPSSACGNGVIDAGEECDDGNNFNLDGCDSNCRYEPIVRWSSFAIQGTAAPAGLGCVPSTNRLGAQAFTGTVLSQFNTAMQSNIDSGTSNLMMQLIGLDDLTGVADGNGLTLGILDASLDPTKGVWPGTNSVDWWFLADNTSVTPAGLPSNVLTNGTLAARVLNAGPSDVDLKLPWPAEAGPVRLRSARVQASIDAAPAPNVPAPPPSQLAAGLTVFQTITGSGTGQGLCGNITVESLAQIPLPQSLATGGSTACGACAGSHAYTYCGAGMPVGPTCNSLLDAIVGGCKVVSCLLTAINPQQPDVVGTDANITPLSLGAGNKVPLSQVTGNDDAYSAYATFDANRQHFTGGTCTATADCQTGKTCSAGTCQ